MAKKELTLEAFQREFGDRWNEMKGNWKEEKFDSLLNKYNFEEDEVDREFLRVQLKNLGFFEGGSKASTKTVSEDLAALIKQQDAKVKINPHIIDRMIKRFAARVTLALSQRDPELTLDLYAETEALPQTQTEQDLELKGYHIDGSLLAGNDSLVICFKGTKPCVLKTLTEKEAERMALVLPQLQQSGKMLSSYIVDMEIVSSKKKQFVVMPLMPTTLEQLKLTAPEDVKRAYLQMKEALTLLHKKGFAHMDIKPSNICINHAGDFVLIDFGSAVPFNTKSASTAAYIPHGLAPNPARPEVDWWMLAATLSEKTGNSDRWAKNPTREETLESLQSFQYIVNDLQPFLKN